MFRRFLIVLIVIIACDLTPATAQEPNDILSKLKFLTSSTTLPWLPKDEAGKIPLRPSHVAEFYVPELHFASFNDLHLLETDTAKHLSPEQVRFLNMTEAYYNFQNIDGVENNFRIRLYALSEKDAKMTAQACLEGLITDALKKKREVTNQAEKLGKNVNELQKKLGQKRSERDEAKKKWDTAQKRSHYIAVDEARESVQSLNKKLNDLDIKIAGVEERLNVIERFKTEGLSKGFASDETRIWLEQQMIDQTIELQAARAEKRMADRMRRDAEDFLELHKLYSRLFSEEDDLSDTLRSLQDDLRWKEKQSVQIWLPKVLLNEVTIYRVSNVQN